MTSQVQVLDKQSTHILNLNAVFQEILNAETPTDRGEKLKRLEQMEQLVVGYFQEASATYERGWGVILLIIEEGLWQFKEDANGNYYTNYAQYVQDFYEQVGKYVSQRTIHSRVMQFRALGQLGVEAGVRTQVVENMPHIANNLLRKVVDSNGEIRELEPAARKQMLEAVGITGLEGVEIGDREAVREFFTQLPELDHREASSIVARIVAEWKKRFVWFRREKILTVRFYQAGKNRRTQKEIQFKLIKGDVDDPVVSEWLRGMMQP